MNISGKDIFPFVLFAAAFAAAAIYSHFAGPPFLLQRWAKERAFRIEHYERRTWRKGPYTWDVSPRGVRVYYVRGRDFEGRERAGWVRCSECWGSDETEVSWDDKNDNAA